MSTIPNRLKLYKLDPRKALHWSYILQIPFEIFHFSNASRTYAVFVVVCLFLITECILYSWRIWASLTLIFVSVPGLWSLYWTSSWNPIPAGHSPAGGLAVYLDSAEKKHRWAFWGDHCFFGCDCGAWIGISVNRLLSGLSMSEPRTHVVSEDKVAHVFGLKCPL